MSSQRTHWRVMKTGVGSECFDRVKILDSGALECRNIMQRESGQEMPVTTKFFGPGMWVSAELEAKE